MTNEDVPVSYGDEFAKCFYMKEAPSYLIRPESRYQVAMTRLALSQGLPNPTRSVVPERGFTISIHLVQPVCRGWGTWVAGKFLPVSSWALGGVGIYDLESDPIAIRPSAFESLHYNLPRSTLDAFTEDCGLPRIDTLSCGQGIQDLVLFHLTQSVLPCLNAPERYSPLFLDGFVHTLCAHLARTYSGGYKLPNISMGGLTPWRQRRILDFLNENLDGKISLSMLASECGLSVSHFARAFKLSFGASVHRYLILRRIERAKALLVDTSTALSAIAIESGFSDQAAFSRTFKAVVGAGPRQWRCENTTRKIWTLDSEGGV
jgi:AraC family transcriptional regulator